MDSDDWIETDMIATLYQLIRTNEAGLATCGYIIENEDGRPIYHINEVKSGKLTQWEAIHSCLTTGITNTKETYGINYIIKKSLTNIT